MENEKKEYLCYKSSYDILWEFQQGIASLDENYLKENKRCTLVCGGMIAFDIGISNFLNELYKKEKKLFLLSEVTGEYRRITKERIVFPFVCTPHLLAKEILIREMDLIVSNKYKDFCLCDPILSNVAECYEMMYEGQLGENYSWVWTFYANQYVNRFLEALKPKTIILWNAFYPFHILIKKIASQKGIPVYYLEFGSLPGTFSFDKKGQMGGSSFAVKCGIYRYLPVSRKQLFNANEVLTYLRQNNVTRYKEPRNIVSVDELQYYKKKRPTIVFFGQNDAESGLRPFTDETRRYHSPFFKSSLDALSTIKRLSYQCGWNVIYKPHPIVIDRGESYKITGVDIVEHVSINSLLDFADVVVTIASQISYMALIKKIPVVMLGYNQLHNKGCTYEVDNLEDIENKIRRAIKFRYTKEQERCFQKHIAKMLKFYLYDDLIKRSVRYGKKL